MIDFISPANMGEYSFMAKLYQVYVLLCVDNTLYTGITDDIPHRLETHNLGKGSKYVRSRLPVKLIYREELPDKSAALKRESEIKGWSREQKIKNLKLFAEIRDRG